MPEEACTRCFASTQEKRVLPFKAKDSSTEMGKLARKDFSKTQDIYFLGYQVYLSN